MSNQQTKFAVFKFSLGTKMAKFRESASLCERHSEVGLNQWFSSAVPRPAASGSLANCQKHTSSGPPSPPKSGIPGMEPSESSQAFCGCFCTSAALWSLIPHMKISLGGEGSSMRPTWDDRTSVPHHSPPVPPPPQKNELPWAWNPPQSRQTSFSALNWGMKAREFKKKTKKTPRVRFLLCGSFLGHWAGSKKWLHECLSPPSQLKTLILTNREQHPQHWEFFKFIKRVPF